MRLLFILDRCGEPVDANQDSVPSGAVCVLRGQKRLQALDFWLRNPDYLADELLAQIENGSAEDVEDALIRATTLMAGDEPDLSRYPMIRWRFGAWEPLDDALSLLVAHGLISVVPIGAPPSQIDRWDYYLLEAGRDLAAELRAEAPDLRWYDERVTTVVMVAGDRSGNQLKEIQYKQAEYERTAWRTSIDSITERVRGRLERLKDQRAGLVR
ncbi:hypothetical protein [Nonomuraea dietziae]|uniref:Uncharacterized protein n=1 Tax=Nonomuraea dietziae TaxID=65515 RepID=A0A7W5V8Z6_9ACTN|nr:hypothetical protein [Nonomuraea dietziae]MBB3729425.1 hypothetical protein [Nonomuraea dietziae]